MFTALFFVPNFNVQISDEGLCTSIHVGISPNNTRAKKSFLPWSSIINVEELVLPVTERSMKDGIAFTGIQDGERKQVIINGLMRNHLEGIELALKFLLKKNQNSAVQNQIRSLRIYKDLNLRQ